MDRRADLVADRRVEISKRARTDMARAGTDMARAGTDMARTRTGAGGWTDMIRHLIAVGALGALDANCADCRRVHT
jgi:hypothetical protein